MPDHTTDGDLETLTATFISRRVVDCNGTYVRRLLVSHDDEELSILVDPDADAPLGLYTGDIYEFTNVVFCTTATETLDDACPDCGGPLRRGTTLDAWPEIRTAAERLDLEYVGVVTAASRLTEASTPTGVDASPTTAATSPSSPSTVCTVCGTTTPGCSTQ